MLTSLIRKFHFIAFFMLGNGFAAYCQSVTPAFINPESKAWSDSVFATLSYEQKIGQLFMVDAFSNKDANHAAFIDSLIIKYHIGGVIFFQGGPVRQALLTNRFQKLTKVPLMIGIDGEWGLSMRLDSTVRFPRQMTLGAANNDSLVYEMALEIGRQCNRMKIHTNFAPVADINNNPLNPVINSRSFGENKLKVTASALNYMQGLHEKKIISCGKHFPGHGNTDTDSHYALPKLLQTIEELDTVELYPFRELMAHQLASVMVAHLFIPALDTAFNQASTLSREVVTKLLRSKLGFEGLVFTDALNMKGVASFYPSGELELKALQAGNDILLYSANVEQAWMRIHFAIQNCEIDQEEIDAKVKRILMAKHWGGLNNSALVDTTNLIADLNNDHAKYLSSRLFEKAITVLRNDDSSLPLISVPGQRIASLVVNDSLRNPFQEMLLNYDRVNLFRCDRDPSSVVADSLFNVLSTYDKVIFSIHNTSVKATSGYGISDAVATLMNRLNASTKLIAVVFGNSYCLTRLPGLDSVPASILSYEDTWAPQYYTAQLIYGAAIADGMLPVTPVKGYEAGMGLCFNPAPVRLRFGDPEESGIAPENFSMIDRLAEKAISERAIPGCQVLVAWKGNVVYQKSFGYFTYEKNASHVTNTDLYDIASITKIAATALALMKLQEEGKIDIDRKASRYFHELKKTNKKDLVISDILTHQAGLKSWIPFWQSTLENGKISYNIFHPEKDVNYSVQVCDSLFILNSYRDKIWDEIYESPVGQQGVYLYSDLGMLIMQRVIEEVTEMPLDAYLEKNFYEPLGLTRLMFNPVQSKSGMRTIPTEMDTAFRKKLVNGFVHDPAAAMLGGVAGNAGLFSDAGNLAVIMQMLLNKGKYGGMQFFKPETVDLFTSRFNENSTNRRGLVFDKPDVIAGKNGPTAISASPATFGHSGFTGTAAWADPDHDLVFIFLSNRVHPSAENKKLATGNYRTDIMEGVYEIIKNAAPAP